MPPSTKQRASLLAHRVVKQAQRLATLLADAARLDATQRRRRRCLVAGCHALRPCSFGRHTKFGIMHVDVHNHAWEDLDRLWKEDPDAAAVIEVVLEEVQADPRVIDKLTQHGNNEFGSYDKVNVKRLIEASRNKRGDVWRWRVLETPATGYRVIYGYHIQTRQICVLAVASKEEIDDYRQDSDLAKRVARDWLGLS